MTKRKLHKIADMIYQESLAVFQNQIGAIADAFIDEEEDNGWDLLDILFDDIRDYEWTIAGITRLSKKDEEFLWNAVYESLVAGVQ